MLRHSSAAHAKALPATTIIARVPPRGTTDSGTDTGTDINTGTDIDTGTDTDTDTGTGTDIDTVKPKSGNGLRQKAAWITVTSQML